MSGWDAGPSHGLAAVAQLSQLDQRKMLPEACILKGNSDVSHVPFLLHICGELSKAGNVSALTLK